MQTHGIRERTSEKSNVRKRNQSAGAGKRQQAQVLLTRTDCHSDSVHLSRSSLIQFVPPLSVVRSMGYGVCKA